MKGRAGLGPPGRDETLAVVVVGGMILASFVVGPGSLNAYLLPKLVWVGTFLMLGAILWARRPVVPSSRVVMWASALVVLAVTMAVIASTSTTRALLGGLRQQGAVSYGMVGIAALVGMTGGSVPDRRLRPVLAGCTGIALVVVVGLALLEMAGVSPLRFDQTFSGRPQSAFGNPAVSAGAVLLFAPVAVGATVGRRWLSVALSVVGVVGLAAFGTRGAWLGAVVAVGVGAVARLGRRAALVVAGATVVAFAAIAAVGRLSTIGSAFAGRTQLWRIGAEAVAGSPLVGYGPEGFGAVSGQYISQAFIDDQGRFQLVDRAHQAIVDVALDIGVVGAAAVVVIWGAMVVVAVRAIRRGSAFEAGLGLAVVAFLVHQQAFFVNIVTEPILWLWGGMLAHRHAQHRALDQPRWLRLAAGVAAVAIAFASLVVSVGAYRADRFDRQAIERHGTSDALALFGRANDLRPDLTLRSTFIAARLLDSTDASELQRGIELIERQLDAVPDDPVAPLSLATLQLQQYRVLGDPDLLETVIADMTALLEEDPLNGEIHLKLGTAQFYAEQYGPARVHWEQAAVLMPWSATPTTNLAVLDEIESTG